MAREARQRDIEKIVKIGAHAALHDLPIPALPPALQHEPENEEGAGGGGSGGGGGESKRSESPFTPTVGPAGAGAGSTSTSTSSSGAGSNSSSSSSSSSVSSSQSGSLDKSRRRNKGSIDLSVDAGLLAATAKAAQDAKGKVEKNRLDLIFKSEVMKSTKVMEKNLSDALARYV